MTGYPRQRTEEDTMLNFTGIFKSIGLVAALCLGLVACGEFDEEKELVATSGDADGDGYAASEDCDDEDAAINPGAPEVCDDVDQDCDGKVANNAGAWYDDEDGDGYGAGEALGKTIPGREVEEGASADDEDEEDSGLLEEDPDEPLEDETTALSCPLGASAVNTDCDNEAASVNPGEVEICDGLDNDCDAVIDSDAVDMSTWYTDDDGDSYGLDESGVTACEAPEGYVTNVGGDCDDVDETINPGVTETCDGEDQDCDGDADNHADAEPEELEECWHWTGTDCEAASQCLTDPDSFCMSYELCMAAKGPVE